MSILTPPIIGGYWFGEPVHPHAPMNFFSTKIVLQQVGLWCVLTAIVALLTLLFTVLGTITCAVLMGMMMAAARRNHWQAIPVSLTFPGVIIALVHFAKVELPGPQRILLPSLCFGVYWLIYSLTRILVRFESVNRVAPPVPAAITTNELEPDFVKRRSDEWPLDEWQGKWSRETNHEANALRKYIEIEGRHLTLSIVGVDGRAQLLAHGDLKLENAPSPSAKRSA